MSEPTTADMIAPCPFCGGEPRMLNDPGLAYYLQCGACGVDNNRQLQNKAQAVERWNARHLSQSQSTFNAALIAWMRSKRGDRDADNALYIAAIGLGYGPE